MINNTTTPLKAALPFQKLMSELFANFLLNQKIKPLHFNRGKSSSVRVISITYFASQTPLCAYRYLLKRVKYPTHVCDNTFLLFYITFPKAETLF